MRTTDERSPGTDPETGRARVGDARGPRMPGVDDRLPGAARLSRSNGCRSAMCGTSGRAGDRSARYSFSPDTPMSCPPDRSTPGHLRTVRPRDSRRPSVRQGRCRHEVQPGGDAGGGTPVSLTTTATTPAPSPFSSPATRRVPRSTARSGLSSSCKPKARRSTIAWSANRLPANVSAMSCASADAVRSAPRSRSRGYRAMWPTRKMP